jgi:hypothetical protein
MVSRDTESHTRRAVALLAAVYSGLLLLHVVLHRKSTATSTAGSTLSSTVVKLANASSSRVAVCVAGGLRSFLAPEVGASLWKAIGSESLGHVDVFFHVFMGEEVSARGDRLDHQEVLSAAQLLRNATSAARVVNVQLEENAFVCGQQATGAWFKISRCAESVVKYAQRHDVQYSVFVQVRPDLVYGTPFPSGCLRSDGGGGRRARGTVIDRFYHFGEVTFAPFARVEAFIDLSLRVKCCNTRRRAPSQCFIQGHAEPRANFMFDNFLRSQMGPPLTGEAADSCRWTHGIKRKTGAMMNGTVRLMEGQLHGRFRGHVPQLARPEVISLDELITQGLHVGMPRGVATGASNTRHSHDTLSAY